MSGTGERQEAQESRNLVMLMFTMVVWLILLPILGQSYWGRSVLTVFFYGMVASAINASAPSRRARHIMLVVVVGLFVLSILGYLTTAASANRLGKFAEWIVITVLFITPVWLSRHVLEANRVTLNIIFGALCAYFLMGIFWSMLYMEMHIIMPDSFNWIPNSTTAITYVYFSFTTLTTLGYGDISPLNAPVRIFAIMEAFIGQIYLVVLVARLVSLQITDSARSDD